MREKNYKNESYFNRDTELLKKLDDYCNALERNMISSSFLVSDMLKHKKNIFKNCWPTLEFNSPIDERKEKRKNEFMGLYAFATKDGDKIDWKYIGISRTLILRFSHHTKSKFKSSATWAYQLAKHFVEKERLNNETPCHINKYQNEKIHPCYFTFITIGDNMLLHIAEVYAVNKFKAEWNSFRTH